MTTQTLQKTTFTYDLPNVYRSLTIIRLPVCEWIEGRVGDMNVKGRIESGRVRFVS